MSGILVYTFNLFLIQQLKHIDSVENHSRAFQHKVKKDGCFLVIMEIKVNIKPYKMYKLPLVQKIEITAGKLFHEGIRFSLIFPFLHHVLSLQVPWQQIIQFVYFYWTCDWIRLFLHCQKLNSLMNQNLHLPKRTKNVFILLSWCSVFLVLGIWAAIFLDPEVYGANHCTTALPSFSDFKYNFEVK